MRIHGETVSVQLFQSGNVDEYGNDITGYSEPIEVANVLIGTGDTVDLIEDGQPYAIKADKRFCMPRAWDEDLRGALITWNGLTYKVIGAPTPITDANIPSGIDWNIKAEAVLYDG